ncbi:MAG TPA: hypothetical protein P5513_06665 [Candidatus Diapherotrites archaeon]|nr:hypothetical protein [Candidatus Diapherotrites archaeon]
MNPKDLKTANSNKVQAPPITPDMLRNSKSVVCECGGMIFTEKLFFKKISSILSPTGREEIVPMPIIICDKCGKVPSVFDTNNILPDEIRAKSSIIKDEK